MNITYQSQDKSLTVELKYLVGNPRRYCYDGEIYPQTTQCHLYVNEKRLGMGQVIKHYKDDNDPELAARLATKKIIHKVPKDIRKKLWDMLLTRQKL